MTAVAGQQFAAQVLDQLQNGGFAEHVDQRNNPENPQAVAGQALGDRLGDALVFVGVHLIDYHPHHLDPFFIEERFVHDQLVDRLAHPAPGNHDHLGAQHAGHIGIGHVENRSHPGMAGPLDQHKVIFCGQIVKAGFNPAHQFLAVAVFNIIRGKSPRDGDGAHVRHAVLDPVDIDHQHHILVDFVAVDNAVLLPHRLHIGHLLEAFQNGVIQSQGHHGFTVILAGGGNKKSVFHVNLLGLGSVFLKKALHLFGK